MPAGPSYVALGDSYSSGEGTHEYYFQGSPCDRGPDAWPSLISIEYPAAPHLSPGSFFACSGDTTTELLNGRGQGSGEPVSQIQQLKNWVSANGPPGLVTVTIGGDDLGFHNLLLGCYATAGPACALAVDHRISYLRTGAFTNILASTYSKIKTAAGGSANVVVVGYPFIFPTPDFRNDLSADLHCAWLDGDAAQVLSRFQEGQLELDSVMATAASRAGVQFIPLDDVLAGHELCTGDSYINDLGPAAGHGHPNLTGQFLMAQDVASQLGLLTGNGGANQRRAHRRLKDSQKHAKAPAKVAPGGSRVNEVTQGPPMRPVHQAKRHGAAAAVLSIGSTVPDGQVSVPYSGFLWANGGTGPYSWAVTAGSLPAGLSMDPSTGIISGTPTGSGTSSFTTTATDSSSPAQSASASLSITVAPTPPVAVQGNDLPDPTVGQQYAQTLSATGGLPPYTWSVSSGSLPTGLSLDPSSGAITGTPTGAGPQAFTVTATDSSANGGNSATASYSINVASAAATLALSEPQLPGGSQGVGYTGALTSTGGMAPLFWSITNGALPDGLTLDPGTGVISGIPTASGTFSFSAQVVDGTSPTPQSAAESLSITIAPSAAPAIATSALPDAAVGTPYDQPIDASGGVAPYSWSVSSGVLPDGLSLDPDTGTISGTPTTAGSYSFDVSLADSSTPNSQDATVSLSLTVDPAPPPPAMTVTDTATGATVGDAYEAAVIPSGGTAPYSYAINSGSLPPGLSIDSQAGTITGTPTAMGTYNASIQVTDSSSPNPQTATDAVSIIVQPPGAFTITTSSLPDANVGEMYAQPVTVTGGTDPDNFAITNGGLPDGLNLDPGSGIISGTPTGTGTSSFTVTATDSATPNPDTASVVLTLTTNPSRPSASPHPPFRTRSRISPTVRP